MAAALADDKYIKQEQVYMDHFKKANRAEDKPTQFSTLEKEYMDRMPARSNNE